MRGALRDRRAIGGLVALLLAFYAGWLTARYRSAGPSDYYVFWTVSRAAASGEFADVYGAAERQPMTAWGRTASEASGSAAHRAAAAAWRRLEPVSTPFLYALAHLGARGDFDRDFGRFHLVSVAAGLAGLAALALACGFRPWHLVPIAVLGTAFYWPYATDSGFANVSRLQLGLAALLATLAGRASRARDLATGALAALLVLFKPTIVYAVALLAVLWLVERRGDRLARALAAGAVALAGGALLPAAIFGDRASWGSWRAAVAEILLEPRYLGGGLLGKLGLPELAASGVAAVALFALAAAGVVAAMRAGGGGGRSDPRDAVAMVALGAAVYLLGGPVVHSHYFLLALPAVLLAAAPTAGRASRAFALLAFLLLAAHPLLRVAGWTAERNHSLWTFGGAALAAGLAFADFARRRRAAAA